MSLLVETYNNLLSKARSLNSLNQIHISFGNSITPQEVLALDEVLFRPGHELPPLREDRLFSDEELKAAARTWIEDAHVHLQLAGKAEAEPFLRRDLQRSVTLYTDGNPPRGKKLIVALPGANNRLMMPVASLLQSLDAGKVDIVLIRDPAHVGYFGGIEGLADTRDALADALPGFLNFGAYENVSGLGVSAGGLPTLLFGTRLGYQAMLVCGGETPRAPRLRDIGGPAAEVTLRGAVERGFEGRVTVAYGAQSEPDREAAVEICEILGIEPLVVSNTKGLVLHNILFALAEEGRLPSFLSEHLML